MENRLINNPKQMVNILNTFFCTKIQKICTELERRNLCNPLALLRHNFDRWNGRNNIEPFELKLVTPKRVRKLFKMLKNSGSEDLNGLSNKV